jgi:hypothetical protein
VNKKQTCQQSVHRTGLRHDCGCPAARTIDLLVGIFPPTTLQYLYFDLFLLAPSGNTFDALTLLRTRPVDVLLSIDARLVEYLYVHNGVDEDAGIKGTETTGLDIEAFNTALSIPKLLGSVNPPLTARAGGSVKFFFKAGVCDCFGNVTTPIASGRLKICECSLGSEREAVDTLTGTLVIAILQLFRLIPIPCVVLDELSRHFTSQLSPKQFLWLVYRTATYI